MDKSNSQKQEVEILARYGLSRVAVIDPGPYDKRYKIIFYLLNDNRAGEFLEPPGELFPGDLQNPYYLAKLADLIQQRSKDPDVVFT